MLSTFKSLFLVLIKVIPTLCTTPPVTRGSQSIELTYSDQDNKAATPAGLSLNKKGKGLSTAAELRLIYKERRKALGLAEGERLPRLPAVPGFENLKTKKMRQHRAAWLGLGYGGTIAKDLHKTDTPIVYEAHLLRQIFPDLTVRQSLVLTALALERKYLQREHRWCSIILPDYERNEAGALIHHPVGIYKEGKKRLEDLVISPMPLLTDTERRNAYHLKADDGWEPKVEPFFHSIAKDIAESGTAKKEKLAEGESWQRALARRARLGVPDGEPLPRLPRIPIEFQGLNKNIIRRLKCEMLALGPEGNETEDLKDIPTSVVWDAYHMRDKYPQCSLRKRLRMAACDYEAVNGIEPGEYSKVIKADYDDGTIRPAGIPIHRKRRNPTEYTRYIYDLMSKFNITPSDVAAASQMSLNNEPTTYQRRKDRARNQREPLKSLQRSSSVTLREGVNSNPKIVGLDVEKHQSSIDAPYSSLDWGQYGYARDDSQPNIDWYSQLAQGSDASYSSFRAWPFSPLCPPDSDPM